MLTVNHLTRRYVSGPAVDDISFALEAGKTCALLGPNGSGKTTLMKMIAGLVQPTRGEILFENAPIGVSSKARIAYMPTENYFYNYMTVRDAGKYYSDFFSDFSIQKYEAMIDRMELRPRDKIRALSSGMSAKLRLALTLCRDAELMMFDEPLNGVDIHLNALGGRKRDCRKPAGGQIDADFHASGGRAGAAHRLRDLHEARQNRRDGHARGTDARGHAHGAVSENLRSGRRKGCLNC